MITSFFGVPRVGKTTLMAKIATKQAKLIRRGKSPYSAVYTNFFCKGCHYIDFNAIQKYKLYDALVIFDEITLDADNRDFKNFPTAARDYFILHGHLHNDIIYATQDYTMVDKKIRSLTQELWYMSKSCVPFLCEFTVARRIYRTINIDEHNGDLIMGYRFCNKIEALFTSNIKIVFRRFYYNTFNSYDEGVLKKRPIYVSRYWDDIIDIINDTSPRVPSDIVASLSSN